MYKVYKLITTVDSQTFYIGMTNGYLIDRLCRHINQAFRKPENPSAKHSIIREHALKYGIRGLDIILITECPSKSEASDMEYKLVQQYLKGGHPLSNYQLTKQEKPLPIWEGVRYKNNCMGAIATPLSGGNPRYFRNSNDAADSLERDGIWVNVRAVRKCLEGKTKSSGGFYWRRPQTKEDKILCKLV